MPTRPYTIARFGGLKLKASPDEVGVAGAINGINFDLDRPGIVRSRDGVTLVATQADTTLNNLYGVRTAAAPRLLAEVNDNGTDQLEARSQAGTVEASQDLTGGDCYFASWGDPTGERVYFTDSGTTIRRFVPSTDTFSQPAGMPDSPLYIATQPNDNRLVVARLSGSTEGDSPSTVMFSDAGDPETWGANNYVELTPGDSDEITGMCAWRNSLFVFKATKFFEFYGNSVDQTGEPVFNYRTVDTGTGLHYPMACVAAPEGIYFVGRDGVYLTNGGAPFKVSRDIDPIFGVGSAADWDYGQIADPVRLAYFNGRLHVAYTAALNSPRCLVYDPATQDWIAWLIPNTSSTRLRGLTSIDDVLYFGTNLSAGSGTLNIYRLSEEEDDDGNAIDSVYQSGRYDFEAPGVEKRPMRSRLWGQGTVTWKTSRNWSALSTGQEVTLGVAPAVADSMVDDESALGLLHSYELSSDGAAWALHMVTQEVDGPRIPQTKAS